MKETKENIDQIVDALGNPIIVGALYGYTNYSSGIFRNNRVIVTSLPDKKSKRVRGIACNDGSFLYGAKSDTPAKFELENVSYQNYNALWPISKIDAGKDDCCKKLLEAYKLKK